MVKMPDVDRAAASKAAVAARKARAKLKERLRQSEIKASRVLRDAKDKDSVAASLRVRDFLASLPAMGPIKTERLMEDMGISECKRLSGLGRVQRKTLEEWVRALEGIDGRPRLTVLVGPSGVGKGTVVQHILENYPQVKLSISATTRASREGEIHGKHYYFVSDAEFDQMLAKNELLEWATVHGKHRYGTPRLPIMQGSANGFLMLLEIDLQGAREVRKSDPSAKLVFLSPPSWEELVRRLVGRGTETAEERERRLETAKVEMAASNEFDAVIVNDNVERAAAELVAEMRRV